MLPWPLPKTGITSFEDTRKREVTVGAGQSSSTSAIYARALNAYAGSRFKVITGYSGTAEIQLAVDRGEVEVNGGESLPTIIVQHPDWLQGKAVLLFQSGLKRFSQLPQVPTMSELVIGKSEEGRSVMRVLAGTAEVGRAILTTPGVPPERLAALRAAFAAMVKDPQFLATAEKRNDHDRSGRRRGAGRHHTRDDAVAEAHHRGAAEAVAELALSRAGTMGTGICPGAQKFATLFIARRAQRRTQGRVLGGPT